MALKISPSARLLLISLAGLILLALSIAFASRLVGLVQKVQPPSASTLERAQAGVSRNSDWQPVIHRLDGLDMVLVPAGCFSMGSTELQLAQAVVSCKRFFGAGKCPVDFGAREAPAHAVCFDRPFWIGRTEVTNRQYGSSSSTDLQAMYRGPQWPRETVTWDAASRFCSAHAARLPTEAEWEYAARGPDGLIFPWGDDFLPHNLVSGRLTLADVASIPAGASWVGALDLSGGVAEWVDGWYTPYAHEDESHPQDPGQAQLRVLRGGSWFSFAAYMVRASHREAADPDQGNSTIGFRCARDLD